MNEIKEYIISALILGFAIGMIAVVPFFGMISLMGLFIASAPLVIVYLIMDGKTDIESIKDSIIYGALCGFCANLSFCIAYVVLTGLIFTIFNYSSNLFLTSMITQAPIWLVLVFIIFIGILSATTNAFTALGTYYIINYIRDNYEKKHGNNKGEL